ncbi:MAG: hypothetical protein WCD37_06950 [Chloroflexia bacterium]
MTTTVQANIILQRMGNALADQDILADGAGKIYTAQLAYDLQDNRLGWCEVFVQDQPGPINDNPLLRIETTVPRGMLKPDSVTMAPVGNNLHIRLSVHATWVGEAPDASSISDSDFEEMLDRGAGDAPEDIQPRLIALSEHVLVGVWTPVRPGQDPRPCVGPDNKPYFGVSELVTRGQEAKIVSEAAGFNDNVDNRHTFQDVPPGSPFHPFVERLAMRGIVRGRPCQP